MNECKSINQSIKTTIEKEKGDGDGMRISEVYFDRYISHALRLMKLFRMWRFDSSYSKFKKFFITFNTSVLFTCNVLLGLSELLKLPSGENVSTVASIFGTFWLHFLGFFKWFYVVWKINDVENLIGELEECYNFSLRMSDWNESSVRLRKEMNTAEKGSSKFFHFWSILVFSIAVHWCLNPVLVDLTTNLEKMSNSSLIISSDEKSFPFQTWIPWDTKSSFIGYVSAYAIQSLGNFASCIGTVSFDIFYISLTMIICAQMKYLNYFLSYKTKSTFYVLEKKLKIAKAHHVAILKFLDSFEKLTSPVMFVHCVGMMGIVCFVSYEVTTAKFEKDMKNVMKICSLLEYIGGCLAVMFAFSYYATRVTSLGLQVGDSAFNSAGLWESLQLDKTISLNEKNKKSALFLTQAMITRSQKPIRLTGGSFYVISLETFRTVVSAAFSYSAMLRNFSED